MNIRLVWPLMASAVFSVAACSGGGGPGGVTVSAPVSTQPAPSAAKGPAVNFQTANSTITYQPASATMAVPDAGSAGILAAASGTGGTATLTVNASGNLTGAVFNIPTKTGSALVVSFPGPEYAALITQPTAQLPQVTSFLYGIFGIPETPPSPYGGSEAFLFTQWAGNNSLSASAYGIWGASDTTGLAGPAGTYALGNLTPAAAVPATGTATFTGSTIGVGSINGTAIQALRGDAQIVANFASLSVTTNFTNLGTQNISTNATGSLPDLSGTSILAGNAYSGPISGSGLTGTVNGNFYGTAAQETAGVWQASGGGARWMGSYGAK